MPLGLLLRALPDLGYISPSISTRAGRHPAEPGQHSRRSAPARSSSSNTSAASTSSPSATENYWRPNAPYLDRIVWRSSPTAPPPRRRWKPGRSSTARSRPDAPTRRGSRTSASSSPPRAMKATRAPTPWSSTSAARSWPISACAAPSRMRSTCRSSSRISSAISPSRHRPDPLGLHRLLSGPTRRNIPSTRRRRSRCSTRPASSPAPAAPASRCVCCPRHGARTSRCGRPSSSSRCEVGIPVEIVRNDGGGFLKQVYDDHAFDLATGWHQYRNDPAVSTTVWYRSGQPKGAPWTNQWDWKIRRHRQGDRRRRHRDRSGQAQGALCDLRQGSQHRTAGVDADRADLLTVIKPRRVTIPTRRAGDRRAGTIFGFPPEPNFWPLIARCAS
jgi:peptide/nickel transport system substrate-binding protein